MLFCGVSRRLRESFSLLDSDEKLPCKQPPVLRRAALSAADKDRESPFSSNGACAGVRALPCPTPGRKSLSRRDLGSDRDCFS